MNKIQITKIRLKKILKIIQAINLKMKIIIKIMLIIIYLKKLLKLVKKLKIILKWKGKHMILNSNNN